MGSFPVTSIPMGSRLRVRSGGKGIAHIMGDAPPGAFLTFDPPIIIQEGDHYKVDLST